MLLIRGHGKLETGLFDQFLKQDTHLIVKTDVLCCCAGCEIKLYLST